MQDQSSVHDSDLEYDTRVLNDVAISSTGEQLTLLARLEEDKLREQRLLLAYRGETIEKKLSEDIATAEEAIRKARQLEQVTKKKHLEAEKRLVVLDKVYMCRLLVGLTILNAFQPLDSDVLKQFDQQPNISSTMPVRLTFHHTRHVHYNGTEY